jgi:hypothetical protein
MKAWTTLCWGGKPTKAVLTQTCVDVFFISSVSETIVAILFPPKPPAYRCGPPLFRGLHFEKHRPRRIRYGNDWK